SYAYIVIVNSSNTMQAHELLRHFRLPELGEVRQYMRTLPTNTLMGFGAFAALTTYWYATRPKALKPPCDLAMQSVEIEGGERARRSALLDSEKPLEYCYSDAQTVYEMFLRGLWNICTVLFLFLQVADRAEFFGSGLIYKGLKPGPDQFIGIFAQNRPEVIPPPQPCFLVSSYCSCRNAFFLNFLRSIYLCVCEASKGVCVFYDQHLPNPTSLHPHTHSPTHPALNLPRLCVVLCHGARIGFFQGDIRLLMDDLKTLQPTIFPVVPRLLNRMFDRIFGQANTPLKRWILDFASKRKEAELRSGVVRSDSMWDKLIFSKVQVSAI
uniref:Acyl-CoA synthetase long chain family member 1 n=1 Tax=Erpetoichthys calabaricus TaxID=27687 RepID=A0A8C4RKI0_ERPCA